MRAGHAGTLDPGATGLLTLCMGRSRKLVSLLTGHSKRYRAVVQLGVATNTQDRWGEVVRRMDVPVLEPEKVHQSLDLFVGHIRQQVPAFSAVKVDGAPLHRKARAGVHVEPPTREVVVHELTLVDLGQEHLVLEVHCGPGVYVRTLASDLSGALGTVGHLAFLRRTAVGHMMVEDAHGMEGILEAARDGVLASLACEPSRALAGHLLLQAPGEAIDLLRQGRSVGRDQLRTLRSGEEPPVVLDQEGQVVCIARMDGAMIRPKRVL